MRKILNVSWDLKTQNSKLKNAGKPSRLSMMFHPPLIIY
jgi:hypothetical protein